jgi:hypothetical protein
MVIGSGALNENVFGVCFKCWALLVLRKNGLELVIIMGRLVVAINEFTAL